MMVISIKTSPHPSLVRRGLSGWLLVCKSGFLIGVGIEGSIFESSPLQGEVRWGSGLIGMTKVFNKTDEKIKRKMLRKNMPQAEVILWSKLKDKGLDGYKFRRQYSVDQFVIDFYCPHLKMAIEIDGDSHFREGADIADKERQTIIESFGITFLRFTNKEIYENIEGVLEKIIQKLP